MLAQLLLHTRTAAYFPIVTLVKTSGGKSYLQKTSCAMMSLLISNLLQLSVSHSRMVTDKSLTP